MRGELHLGEKKKERFWGEGGFPPLAHEKKGERKRTSQQREEGKDI